MYPYYLMYVEAYEYIKEITIFFKYVYTNKTVKIIKSFRNSYEAILRKVIARCRSPGMV